MDQRPPRPQALRVLAYVLAASAVGLLILWVLVKRKEERGWAAMERRVEELTSQAGARRDVRPVLRGQAVPGNAWDEYALALGEANGRPRTVIEIPEAGAVANFLATNGPLLEHLRRGTQRSEVAIPLSSGAGATRIHSILGNWDALWKASTRYARLLIDQGEYREAAERLTDLCLVGCDFSRNAVSDVDGSGMEIRRHALDELRLLALDRRLPEDVLLPLEKELEILDRATPDRAPVLLNDTAHLGRVLLLEPSWEEHLHIGKDDMPTLDWRHVFSKRLLALDLFSRVDEWNRRGAESVAMPWPGALRVHGTISAELRDCSDAFSSLGIRSYAWAAWARATQAKVRLLRAAVHFRLRGGVVPLDDPFGTQLLHQETSAGHLKIWSLGAFGRGEPANGAWSDHDPAGTNHLAIEVDR